MDGPLGIFEGSEGKAGGSLDSQPTSMPGPCPLEIKHM